MYHCTLSLQEWKGQDQAPGGIFEGFKQAIEDKKHSEWIEFEEAVKQWKVEEEIVEAKCKATPSIMK